MIVYNSSEQWRFRAAKRVDILEEEYAMLTALLENQTSECESVFEILFRLRLRIAYKANCRSAIYQG